MSNRVSLNKRHKEIVASMDKYLSKDGLSVQSAGNTPIGKAFTEFYVRNIAFYIDNVTDVDAVQRGLECDRSNDLGIDFIYEKSDENEFWICQSKYRGLRGSLSRESISEFFKIHTRINDDANRGSANKIVRELLWKFNKKSTATFVLLTSCKLSEENKAEFRRQKDEAQKNNPECIEKFNWELIGLSEINDKHRQVKSLDEEPPTVKISFVENCMDLSKDIAKARKDYKTIVTVVKGSVLDNLWKEHRHSLFNHNIRGFLGRRGKNKKIIETLKTEPEFFYLYNNGISAICSNLKFDGKSATCQAFQIINGAQTVCSIGDSAIGQENMEKVRVLLRITQAENLKSEKGLNKKIITYNNSQNVIRDADFRCNDPVQIFLRNQFSEKKFQYCRAKPPYKTLVYAPKRGHHQLSTNEIIISMDDMAKSVYAFKYDRPDKLSSQTQFLFDDTEKGEYWNVFGEEGDETSALMPSVVDELAVIMILNCFINDEIKKRRSEKDQDGNKRFPSDTVDGMVLRAPRHILWAFGFSIRKLYSELEVKKIYKKIISRDSEAFNKNQFFHKYFNRIIHIMRMTLERDGDNGKTLNFKMWLRDNNKVKALMRDFIHFHEEAPIDID